MSQVTVFSPDSAALSYTDKKGAMHGITAEGALYKGGAAMVALKDAAMDSALAKAHQGRYRAAADILAAAFPKAGKAAAVVLGATAIHTNKTSFSVLLAACTNQATPEKGWSKKQAEARVLLANVMRIPAFAPEAAETIDA